MITLKETVGIAERLANLLKSASDVTTALEDTSQGLGDFLSMLEYSHAKGLKNTEEALQYIDNVLTPQLLGIRDTLQAGTEEHIKRLNLAKDLADRLVVRLQMLDEGAVGDFFV